VVQRSTGSEIGTGANTTLERMCSHAAYISEQFLRNGATVIMSDEESPRHSAAPHERHQEVLAALAELQVNETSVSEDLLKAIPHVPRGGMVYVFLSLADPELPAVIHQAAGRGIGVALLVYDAEDFLAFHSPHGLSLLGTPISRSPKKGRGSLGPHVRLATGADFIGDCESAGASVVQVPYGEAT
jgi:hypothetical protein